MTEESEYRRKPLGFAPVVRWTRVGETVMGVYFGSTMVHPKGVAKPFRSHFVEWIEGTAKCEANGKILTPTKGMRISLSGGYLDNALCNTKEGTLIEIDYRGEEENPTSGRNAAKLLDVFELEKIPSSVIGV